MSMSYIFDTMSNVQVKNEVAVRWMGASFEERSVWIQLFSMVLILGGYFFVAWQMLSVGVTALPAYAPVFGVAVALMVIVMVAGHAAVAIASRPEGRDERDRLIEWRAESNSGWLVGAGVILGICAMIASVPNAWTAHLLLMSLFLSEVLKCVLQLVYYRRGM
jgi:predicted membrane channel-forming protein YqfA (hemolysin III family)